VDRKEAWTSIIIGSYSLYFCKACALRSHANMNYLFSFTYHKASPSEFMLQAAPAVAIATLLILYTKVRLWCTKEAFMLLHL